MVPSTRAFPRFGGARRLLFFVLVALLGRVAPASAVTCDPDPKANLILFACVPGASNCTIPSIKLPTGCAIDFGTTTKVTITGTVDLTVANQKAASLSVTAGQIVVQGTIKARSDDNKSGGNVELVAADSIVVTGTVDVSGNSAGLVKMRAGGLVDLTSTGRLSAKGVETSSIGNTASGGTIDVLTSSSFSHSGTIDLSGGPGGSGGSLTVQAGTDITLTRPIDATGGDGDGGDVDLTAGDDVRLQHTIDVGSPTNGGGGSITARAGIDRVGGVKLGGTLTATGSLLANGSQSEGSGWDGGDIELRAFGRLDVSSTIRSVGGFPDGGGGSVLLDSGDTQPFRVTDLDGDLSVTGTIDVHGPNVGSGDDTGSGGDIDIFVGRDGVVSGSMDLSGSFGGGNLSATVGRSLQFDSPVNASGTVNDASGGLIVLETGRATAGSLAVTRTLDATSTNGIAGTVVLKGCSLDLAAGLTVTAKTTRTNQVPKIDLISASTLRIGANGKYLADPSGRVQLVHPAATAPQIGAGVTFSPTVTDSTDSALFPICAACGDGIRQLGEVCDNGAGADGACCNAQCSAFTCPTVTPTPTLTATATAPTRSPTPTRTRTPSPTRTPVATATAIPSPTVPGATPALPFIEPRAVLDCEKTVGKANATLVLNTLKVFEGCALEGFKCLHTKAAGADRAACLAGADRRCQSKVAKLDGSHQRFRDQFTDACAGDPAVVPIELLRSPDVLGYSLLRSQCYDIDITSPDILLGCLQVLGPCEVQEALGVGVPRVSDILALMTVDVGTQGACLPAPVGNDDGLAGLPVAAQVVRCQRAVATNGRRLVSRQLSVARSCVDSLLKCRLSGKPRDACQKVADGCARKLATLDDPTKGARAKMLGAIHKACGTLPPDVLRNASGIGYGAIDERCTELGNGPASDVSGVAACVTRAYGCAGSNVVRQALPLVDTELARVGLSLGNDAFCAVPTPTATATPVPTQTASATPTTTPVPTQTGTPVPTITDTLAPTATPLPTDAAATSTPAPTATPNEPTPFPSDLPTPVCANASVELGEQCDFGDDVPGDGCGPDCRFETLIPGGGTAVADCIAEWAVVNPFNTPFLGSDGLPTFKQSCVDGDPSCDFDGDPTNGRCEFRAAFCMQNADPNLPACTAPPGIAKYVLVSPRPTSAEQIDKDNANALLGAFGRLSSVTATGSGKNTFVFDPPLVLSAPDNCTQPVAIVVERRGFTERSEKFRTNTTSVAPIGGTKGIEDSDTLLLTCRAAPAPTATPTAAAATPTPEVTAAP